MSRRTLDTGSEDLLASLEDGVAVLTMNRPARRNALSGAMLAGLARVLAACELDAEVACVVVTGAGGSFCAGGDVKGMAEGSPDVSTSRAGEGIDARIHAQRVSHRATAGKLYTMPKPTLAVLPGAAAGAGLALALACDLRLASSNAVMTTAFANVGFSGDYGGTYFLSHLVGPAKAREMYFLPQRIDMNEALALGLVNWVVPAEELDAKMREIAGRLARGPRVAYRYMKENINRAMAGAALEDCLDLEATHHVHTGMTEDHRDAAKAFVEKRTPVFKGR